MHYWSWENFVKTSTTILAKITNCLVALPIFFFFCGGVCTVPPFIKVKATLNYSFLTLPQKVQIGLFTTISFHTSFKLDANKLTVKKEVHSENWVQYTFVQWQLFSQFSKLSVVGVGQPNNFFGLNVTRSLSLMIVSLNTTWEHSPYKCLKSLHIYLSLLNQYVIFQKCTTKTVPCLLYTKTCDTTYSQERRLHCKCSNYLHTHWDYITVSGEGERGGREWGWEWGREWREQSWKVSSKYVRCPEKKSSKTG